MDETISNLTLSALAQIRNHQVIQAKFNSQTKGLYPDSYVYAISKSVHPMFQEDILDNSYDEYERLLSHPFQKIYKITYQQVSEVNLYLTEKWGEKKDLKFRDLEKHYKSVLTIADVEEHLIKICRYLCLSGQFEKEFWDSLVLNHNLRVLQINQDFRISEVFPFSTNS